MKKIIKLLFFTIFYCSVFQAQAQNNVPPSNTSNEPLEITADESLEWQRNEKLFIARKNAVAKQGDVSIKAQTLTAHYREDSKTGHNTSGGMEISEITAQDDVVINAKDSEVYGRHAVYDLDKGVAVMTGDPGNRAKMIRYNARGQKTTLDSDKISATFKSNTQGRRVLHSVEAIGNVVITTPAEIITGTYGIYRAESNKAELTGGVTIKRGPNVLQGEKAEVDLNTNTSRMFGESATDSTGTGRVRGIFYPNSDKKPE